MTKQEFLAFSLPYGLKVYVRYSHKPDHSELEKMIGIVDDRIITDIYDEDIAPLFISEYGLCLRPLSDLTKEIEHNREKFVPIDELNNIGDAECDRYNDYFNEENISDVNWLLEPFIIFQKLIEWHFDITNLISKGEAIDVNTLEINPYK